LILISVLKAQQRQLVIHAFLSPISLLSVDLLPSCTFDSLNHVSGIKSVSEEMEIWVSLWLPFSQSNQGKLAMSIWGSKFCDPSYTTWKNFPYKTTNLKSERVLELPQQVGSPMVKLHLYPGKFTRGHLWLAVEDPNKVHMSCHFGGTWDWKYSSDSFCPKNAELIWELQGTIDNILLSSLQWTFIEVYKEVQSCLEYRHRCDVFDKMLSWTKYQY
jgi:hypothetical protein